MASPSSSHSSGADSLVRALGVSDLTWLYLVAAVNLNVAPVIAVGGPKVLWFLGATILLFFLPQGIGGIELAQHMPGEGGLCLWTKESYGDFHGFICGWRYWMTNMFFVPSLPFFVAGVTTYIVGGKRRRENQRQSIVLFPASRFPTLDHRIRECSRPRRRQMVE